MSDNNTNNNLEWPKRYRIRPDGALQIPNEIMAMMEWQPGDEITQTLDRETKSVTLTKVDGNVGP